MINETNKVTSKQVLYWEKRVEVQRVQMTLFDAIRETKESKEFDAIQKAVKQNHSMQTHEMNQRTAMKQM